MNCDITSVDVKSIPVLWFHEIYICISIHIYIYTHICCCFLLLLSALALFLGWYVSMHVICLSIALLVTTSTKSKSPKEIFNPYALCSHFFPPYLKMHSLNNAYLLVSYPPLDSPEQRNPRRDASRGCSGWGYLIQSRSFLAHPKYLLASVQTPDLLFQVWAWGRIRRHTLVQTAQTVARQENFSFSPEEVWCCIVKHTFATFLFTPWVYSLTSPL